MLVRAMFMCAIAFRSHRNTWAAVRTPSTWPIASCSEFVGPDWKSELAGHIHVFDSFQLTRERMGDSVDSIHFGRATNLVLAQVILNQFCLA